MVKIIDYRGYVIFFDIDEEKFYLHSEKHDRGNWVKSLSAAKNNIDDYIKRNTTFEPFWVIANPNGYIRDKSKKIVGIRKDGVFVSESANGTKSVVSIHDEERWMLIDEVNNEIIEGLALIESEINELYNRASELKKKLKIQTLADIKKIKYQDI